MVSSRILLHCCCGPCTTYVNQWLTENQFKASGYFYNPNINPDEEYDRRLLTFKDYANSSGLDVIVEENDFKTEPNNCEACYFNRLKKTAEYALDHSYNAFTTTLLISPYQNHAMLESLGKEIGDAIGVEFFYNDFRSGFREGQQMAKDLGLYRQKYCGCTPRGGQNAKTN